MVVDNLLFPYPVQCRHGYMCLYGSAFSQKCNGTGERKSGWDGRLLIPFIPPCDTKPALSYLLKVRIHPFHRTFH